MPVPKKPAAAPANVPALKLNMPNAAQSWHAVMGLPGHFHPEIPTPLDGPGEMPLEAAEAFIAEHAKRVDGARVVAEEFRAQRLEDDFPDPGEFAEPDCPVELVHITEKAAGRAREEITDHTRLARRALRQAVREEKNAGDLPHVQAQDEALTGRGA